MKLFRTKQDPEFFQLNRLNHTISQRVAVRAFSQEKNIEIPIKTVIVACQAKSFTE